MRVEKRTSEQGVVSLRIFGTGEFTGRSVTVINPKHTPAFYYITRIMKEEMKNAAVQ